MAAKKEKTNVEALHADVKALTEAFWSFRDAMLTDAAVAQSELQVATAGGDWQVPTSGEIESTATLLAALGHSQRLRMAMMLTEGPTTVTTIVETLGLKTTGAAYHHLNVLATSGLVEQPERGTYTLATDAALRINAVFAALFGADDSKRKKKKK